MNSVIDTTQLRTAIAQYQQSIGQVGEAQAKEDFERIAVIACKVAAMIEAGDIPQAREALLAFSRGVSDSYFVQPSAFKPMGEQIASIKAQLGLR